ncbi:MAG: tetratricopeptide repeat protein [Treponema sp.]|nr:tetratricopeptide repeat protein [Treponema sp.]
MKETVERLNNQAILLAKDGSYKEAIACFSRALTLEKNNELLWYNLALTYRDAGKTIQAKEALLKAKEISPNDQDVIEELAIILFNLEEHDASIELCLEGLKLNPENYNLWNTRGVNFFNKGNYTEACESFENAVYLNPYYDDALFNLRDAYKKLGNKVGETECSLRLKELKNNGDNR